MTERRQPPTKLMDWKEGESAIVGAVAFASIYAAEAFIDWKLKQGLTIRLWPDAGNTGLAGRIIVEFEPYGTAPPWRK